MRFLLGFLCVSACLLCIQSEVPVKAVTHGESGLINKRIDTSEKAKRQNKGEGGEEVDLSTIPDNGQGGQPANPQQPGQNPFGFGNPYFPQQPFYNGFGGNGFQGGPQNYPGGLFQGGFPQGGYNQGGFNQGGFNQGGFNQGGFNQGYPQVPGRNVILQNNGKQYLVQPITGNQRIVQKNGKQYLLQPLTGTNAAVAGIQTFNVPDAALTGLPGIFGQNGVLNNAGVNGGFGQNAALTGVNPGLSLNNPNYAQIPGFSFSPAVAAVQPNALASNAKLTSLRAPQQGVPLNNAQTYENIPFQIGGAPQFLPAAVGGVAAQIANQAAGQQYAQYAPQPYTAFPLNNAYARGNQAGYGLYPVARSDGYDTEQQDPIKRETKASSKV